MKKILLALLFILGVYVAKAQTEHKCPNCNGNGEIVRKCTACHNGAVMCKTCDYSGKVESRCNTCNGSGSTTQKVRKVCYNCNGQRYFKKENSRPCSCRGGKRPITRNGKTEYIDCDRCKGTGSLVSYTNEACSVCGGSGYYGHDEVSKSCNSCGGNGSVSKNCPTCLGKGAFACTICKGYANINSKCGRCICCNGIS